MSSKAVFLDKDGTLIENVPYNVDPKHILLTPGAGEGLRLLHQAGYQLIVITNQSGVARGYFSESALIAVEQRLRDLLAVVGVPLAGFYYCPHHPEGISPYAIKCDCRKPRPGLLKKAARELGIQLSQSWFVGDILHDVEAGRAAGCRTVLIDNGNETEWNLSRSRLPHHTIADLHEAARVILAIDGAALKPEQTPEAIPVKTLQSTSRAYPGFPKIVFDHPPLASQKNVCSTELLKPHEL